MYNFNQPFQLGSLTIKNRVILAPLAGVSDIPFRRICQELGAGFTYVEMLSSTAIVRENQRTLEMMARHKDEATLGVQLTGPSPEQIGQAISMLEQKGFDAIDINMGCPVRKVVKKGWGSAILKEPERVSQIVETARDSTRGPLSVKVRLGYDRINMNISENAKRIANAGADMLTIHGRTRSENYANRVDHKGIRIGVTEAHAHQKSPIILTGNGDVMDSESAQKMVQQTNCQAVMISRGALGNPWIFREILNQSKPQTTLDEWLDVILRHLSYQKDHYGPGKVASVISRKHLVWYATGFPGIKKVREKLGLVESLDDARSILKSFAQTLPSNTIRFQSNERKKSSNQSTTTEQPKHERDPKYQMDRSYDRAVAEDGY